MTIKEFVNTVNSYIKDNNPIQTRYYDEWLCDFNIETDDISRKEMWQGNTDGHRWYDLSDVVYKITDGNYIEYYMTRLITRVNGDSQTIEDCYHRYTKLEMVYPKEITNTIYISKNDL